MYHNSLVTHLSWPHPNTDPLKYFICPPFYGLSQPGCSTPCPTTPAALLIASICLCPQKQFQQVTGKKQVTGYILFAAEIRKSITLKNPTANFGEVSRLVGIEWKRLTETDRKIYEDRAHQMNLENAERALSGNGPDSPQASQVGMQGRFGTIGEGQV